MLLSRKKCILFENLPEIRSFVSVNSVYLHVGRTVFMASNISTMPERGVETRIPEQNIEIPELERGIETRGIERVPSGYRADLRILNNFTLWLSANMVISTFALGTL